MIAPAGWPITRHPRIAHLMPYLRGDSLRAIWFAVHVLRARFIDQNAQVDAYGVWWIMHWATVRKNGYRWYWTGHLDTKGREVRKRVPKHWQVHHLSTRRVRRLRTRKHGGRAPHQVGDHMRRWADLNVTGCLEGKGTTTHAPQSSYDQLAFLAELYGCRMVYMTLQSIPGWRKRLTKAAAAGLPCALLPRGRKPADWSTFEALGVQVWGRWRR